MKRTMLPLFLLAVVAGCGGGGSGSGAGSPAPGPAPAETSIATALVRVDVPSGEVQVIPQSGDSRAVFSGSAVEITTSRLLEDSGDVTRRIVRATIKNTLNEVIGNEGGTEISLRGVQPMLTPATDRRSSTVVRTIAGTGTSGSQDGPAASATLGAVTGSWIDPADQTVFWVQGTVIRKLSGGRVTTVAVPGPVRSMTGYANDLFVASETAIYRFDKRTGAFLNTVAGDISSGLANGQGTAARFNGIKSLAWHPEGYILVADSGNDLVRIVDDAQNPSGGVALNGFFADNASAVAVATMPSSNGPFPVVAVLTDGTGNVLLTADQGQTSGIIGTLAPGDAVGGSPAFRGTSLAAVGSTIIVGDGGNGTIKTMELIEGGIWRNPSSWWTSWVAGASGPFVDGPGNLARFGNNLHVGTTSNNEILVFDSANFRLRRVESATGQNLLTSGFGGPTSGTVTVGNADSIRTNPQGSRDYIYYDGFISAGMTIQKDWAFSLSSGITSFQFLVTVSGGSQSGGPLPASAGTGSSQTLVRTLAGRWNNAALVDGPVSLAAINNPLAIQANSTGEVFFLDEGPNSDAVRVLSTNGQVKTIIGSRDVVNLAGATGYDFGTPAMRAFWVNPGGDRIFLATDSAIFLARYVAPNPAEASPGTPAYFNPVNWKIGLILGSTTLTGTVDGTGGTARMSTPNVIEFDETGQVGYLAQSNLIRKITFMGGDDSLPNSWRLSFGAGAAGSGAVDGAPTVARFNNVRGLAIDRFGFLWIADGGNHTVRRLEPSGAVATLAGSAGVSAYTDGFGNAARFTSPEAIDTDSYGYAYVMSQNRIRRVGPTGEVRTVVRSGPIIDGMGNSAGIQSGSGIAIGPHGDAFFGDVGTLRTAQRVVLRN